MENKKYDRRQKKTRAAIFEALSKLLEKKSFGRISVQDIIQEANIGRSTFYAHFETKDDVLKSLCMDIFDHVVSEELTEEKTHDFSKGSGNLGEILVHFLYHLQDDKKEMLGLLGSDSRELFIGYIKMCLVDLFKWFVKRTNYGSDQVPQEFKINYLAGSFAETILWWVQNRMTYSPETVAEFYVRMIEVIEKPNAG